MEHQLGLGGGAGRARGKAGSGPKDGKTRAPKLAGRLRIDPLQAGSPRRPGSATASAGGSTWSSTVATAPTCSPRSSRRWPRSAELPRPPELREDRREASCAGRSAPHRPKGFERIAVVCGAWHVPALATMPRPSTTRPCSRACRPGRSRPPGSPGPTAGSTYESGYGAGIESPGWYSISGITPTTSPALDDPRGTAAPRAGTRRLVRLDISRRYAWPRPWRPCATGPCRASRS